MIQLTIMKITGYGPWTLTLGSDREHELQMLQASLYKEVQDRFSRKDSLVFLNRGDEYFAVTNGLTLEDHVAIQEHLESKFDLRLAMSIGHADTPYGANLRAFEAKKSGVLLNGEHAIYGRVDESSEKRATIMHMDVEDLASSRKTKSPYEISNSMFSLLAKMSAFFMEKGSLAFFLGGDNFMIVTHGDSKSFAREFTDLVQREDDITLNCGIGHAGTSRDAARLATKSLDTIREMRDAGTERPRIYELSC